MINIIEHMFNIPTNLIQSLPPTHIDQFLHTHQTVSRKHASLLYIQHLHKFNFMQHQFLLKILYVGTIHKNCKQFFIITVDLIQYNLPVLLVKVVSADK